MYKIYTIMIFLQFCQHLNNPSRSPGPAPKLWTNSTCSNRKCSPPVAVLGFSLTFFSNVSLNLTPVGNNSAHLTPSLSIILPSTGALHRPAPGAALLSPDQLRVDAVRRILSAHGPGVGLCLGEKTRQLAGGARLDCTGSRDHGLWLFTSLRQLADGYDRVRVRDVCV